MRRQITRLAATGLLLVAVSACSGEEASTDGSSTTGSTSSSSPAAQSSAPSSDAASSPDAPGAVTLSDGWVKATDEKMTAVFGRLQNPLPQDLTLVSGSTDVAKTVELHEVTGGSMKPVKGGMTVPAGKTLDLEPGGLHIMLMGVEKPVVAGDEVTLTLKDSEGGTHEFTVPARTFDGGDEDYEGGHGHSHEHGGASGGHSH